MTVLMPTLSTHVMDRIDDPSTKRFRIRARFVALSLLIIYMIQAQARNVNLFY